MSDDEPLLTLDEFNRRIGPETARMAAANFVASLDNPLWRSLVANLPEPTRWQRLTAPFRRLWWRCEAAWEAFRDV